MSCRCIFIADESKPSATSHCAGCHCTYSSVSAFDLHQRLDNGQLVCLPPAYTRRQSGELLFAVVRRTPDGKPVWGKADSRPFPAAGQAPESISEGVAA